MSGSYMELCPVKVLVLWLRFYCGTMAIKSGKHRMDHIIIKPISM